MFTINAGGFQEIYLGNQPQPIAISRMKVTELEELLQPLVYPHLEVCRKHLVDDRSWYLYALALLMLAQLVVDQFTQGARHFYIPGLPPLRNNVVHPGYIDVIEIVTPDGGIPSLSTRKALLRIIRSGSTDVAALLEVIFNEGLRAFIGEFKFLVGDGIKHGEFMLPQRGKPEAKHLAQVQRYIALSMVGYALRQGVSIEDVWGTVITSSRRLDGRLEYFRPDADSITFEVISSLNSVQQTFYTEYCLKLLTAERYARIRAIERTIGKALKKFVQALPKPSKLDADPVQQSIPFESSGSEMDEKLRRHIEAQVFVDEMRILFQPFGEWSPTFHLDRFFLAAKAGKVNLQEGFSWQRGGKARCINPRHRHHEDDLHSMHVSIAKLRVTCSWCRMDAVIASESVPVSLREGILPGAAARQRRHHGYRAYRIDQRHFTYLGELQVLLQDALERELEKRGISRNLTPARQYLAVERRLDPRMAWRLGGGFCDDAVTREMIARHGLDFATHFGIVQWSTHGRHTLAPFLKTLGYQGWECERTALERVGKEPEDVGYVTRHPVAALRHRVTWPMELYDNLVVNCYGRSVFRLQDAERDKAFRHRKLSREFTEAPQGGFRATLLASHWTKGVLVTEGIPDAIALMSITGHDGIVALGGTNNPEFLEELAYCNSQIGIAFDHDKPGSESTGRAIKSIREANPKADVYDFSAEFRKERRDIAGCKDWNEVVIKYQGISFQL